MFRALGLDEAERLTVGAPQHVVDVTDSLPVRHAGNFELRVFRLVERPADFLQKEVDEAVAGLGFVVVVCVGRRFIGLAHLGHRSTGALQFLIEIGLVAEEAGQLPVLLFQRLLLRLDMGEGLAHRLVAARQRAGVEREPVGRPAAPRIGAGEPEGEVEQLLHRPERVALRDGLLLVNRAVADAVDVFRLGEDGLAGQSLEARLVQQRGDVVLIGKSQAGVILERPFDRNLDRLSREEGRRCW